MHAAQHLASSCMHLGQEDRRCYQATWMTCRPDAVTHSPIQVVRHDVPLVHEHRRLPVAQEWRERR